MKFMKFFLFVFFGLVLLVEAQEKIYLTLESAVDIAMKKSYRIRMLEVGVKSSTMKLKARQAALKTQVFMNLKTPDMENVSDYKWNSNLEKDEIVRQNTVLWQSELSVQQPLIFWGYPTNGFLSLNYKLYRYSQSADKSNNQTDFYNRLYFKFQQPFFLPNDMKNQLEEAELELKDNQLSFLADQMEIVDDISNDYYDLFERNYKRKFYTEQVNTLSRIHEIAYAASLTDSSYLMDVDMIQLSMNNAKEQLMSEQSNYREIVMNLRQKLRLNKEDTVIVSNELNLNPIEINIEQAASYGLQLNPELERLEIEKKKSEIAKEYEKGENTFHMTLEATYGLEKKNEVFRSLWDQFDNSNSISLNAYIPIWDGGESRYRIQAAELNIMQNDLAIVEKQQDIKKDIFNSFTNMNELFKRAKNMQGSVTLAENICENRIKQYTSGTVTLENLLQSVEQIAKAKDNLIELYIDYRGALLDLTKQTYYDFEKGYSLLDSFSEKQ